MHQNVCNHLSNLLSSDDTLEMLMSAVHVQRFLSIFVEALTWVLLRHLILGRLTTIVPATISYTVLLC